MTSVHKILIGLKVIVGKNTEYIKIWNGLSL